MKKYKIMLMLVAVLVIQSGVVSAAEYVEVEWTYTQTTTAIGSGALADIEIVATRVGGAVEDPTVFLTATLPDPNFTQREPGGIVVAGDVGYMENSASCERGITVRWDGGIVLYTVTVNYGVEKTWYLPVQLKMRSDNATYPEDSAYHLSVDIYDLADPNDFVGVFTPQSKWGNGCSGHEHELDPVTWVVGNDVSAAAPLTVEKSGDVGIDANGDDLGFSFYRSGAGTGTIEIGEIRIGGTLFADLASLSLGPCLPWLEKDTADLNGDCIVDSDDLAMWIAYADWLDCGLNYNCP